MARFPCVRSTFLVFGVIQLVAIFERQIFDFMGYMWLCIACNFFHVIAVILGIFGGLQHRSCYVIMVVIWNWLWIGWNTFIICLHLDVGVLQKDMSILNLGTRMPNWWLINGPGCVVTYNFSAVDPITFRAQIIRVDNCLLDYYYIEIVQSSLQIALCVGSISCAIVLLHLYKGKDVSALDDALKPVPMPGYTLSLQHSIISPDDPYHQTKSLPVLLDSSYETVPRNTLPSQRTNTRRSTKSSGTTSRETLSKSRRASSHDGLPRTRASVRTTHARGGHDPNGIVAVMHPFGARREVNPAVRPHPLYVPSSVSPYPSRAPTEISF